MRCLAALLALVCCAETKPRILGLNPSISLDPYIVGGTEATPEEFPWQLSVERLSGSWYHSCSASLLSTNAALTAAMCVDAVAVETMRIVAGLHKRSDQSSAQISAVSSYKMHENFGIGNWTFPNDIAIITLAEPFDTSVSNVALLTLPLDNSNQFVGTVCTLSGWGRNKPQYGELTDALQKVDMPVISTYECTARMETLTGPIVCDDSQISVHEVSNSKGTCDGDSGGPLNCPLFGRSVVAGVGSLIVSRQGGCLIYYPSIFTRTGFYLNWIILNTPPSS